MSLSDDVSVLDYFHGVSAAVGNVSTGPVFGFLGLSSWSVTIASNDGAKGTLSIQFSDFHGRGAMTFPFDTGLTFIESSNVAISGTAGTLSAARVGRTNDNLNCTGRVIRLVFTPTTGSAGTLYAAMTLKAR